MKAWFKVIRDLFWVYNEYTGSHRISREMVGTAVMILSSVWELVTGSGLFQGNEGVAIATGIFGAIGMALRITSKGGESTAKPRVRKKLEEKQQDPFSPDRPED